jgi:single-strand DNA-binding protein
MSNFTINRVVLVGRLTRDPELRSLPSGRSACTLRIACNASRLGADGARVEHPNYFDVATYGSTAEAVARYLQKGRRVGVDGKLEWREWETSEQEHRQAVSIVADTVQFLDSSSPERGSRLDGAGVDGDDDDDGDLAGVGAGELGELEVAF